MKSKSRNIVLGTGTVSAVLSAFLALFFHRAFFRTIIDNVEPGAGGVLIFVSMCVLLFVLNFLVTYLVLYFGRTVGKVVVSFFMIGNSIALYFIDVFNALIDDRMMGNVFHTQMSEATSFYSPLIFVYVILLGILPVALLWMVRLKRENWKGALAVVMVSLGMIGGTVGVNRSNFLWIDKNVPVFGSQVLPWCYVVNTFRYISISSRENAKEIMLPDAQIVDSTRSAIVLVIGESARRANFQIYGYDRPTNPRLSQVEGLKTYKVNSVAANTLDAVRAIVSYSPDPALHEILPNYMERSGVSVEWRTSNWGEPPLHIARRYNAAELSSIYGADPRYDGVLFEGVKDFIVGNEADKVLVVIHTYTSHGPTYSENYPPEYEVFTPVCKTVEIAKCPLSDLVNAYDNTIVYTDALLGSLIDDLKSIDDRRCAVIFLSDHGESLGENGNYMHGTGIGSYESKPQEYEVPFVVWSNIPGQQYKEDDAVDQYHVYHSVMGFLGIGGEAFDESRNVFK